VKLRRGKLTDEVLAMACGAVLVLPPWYTYERKAGRLVSTHHPSISKSITVDEARLMFKQSPRAYMEQRGEGGYSILLPFGERIDLCVEKA